jgi:SAM-dependent methyltransferase
MGPKDWFACWFGTEYKRLYPHRDRAQAAAQVAALFQVLGRLPESPRDSIHNFSVLDIGCGSGRHLLALRDLSRHATRQSTDQSARSTRIVGVDLSPVLLHDARTTGSAVARADMRRLPFADDTFDLVANFFTSFGYFDTPAEDAEALREFARVTRSGGFLFLDLPNRAHVLENLVATEVSESGGRRVEITRVFDDGCVVKRIRISDEDSINESGIFQERVRLWSLDSLGPVLDDLGLETAAVLGDENGAAFDSESSPRMSLLLRTAHRVAA